MKRLTYGSWLKRERRRRSITQAALERAAQLADKYVSRLENSDTLPEDDVRDRVHTVFGTSDAELADLGIVDRLVAPDGSVIYVRPERGIPLPDTALDQLRDMIRAGEIDEDGAQAIIEWWGAMKRLREE